jgi:hypothetical protein
MLAMTSILSKLMLSLVVEWLATADHCFSTLEFLDTF